MPSYRLAPEYTYPYIIDDIFRSFIVAQEFCLGKGVQADKFISIGVSAGANLAFLLVLDKGLQDKYGIDSTSFDTCISLAGVLNLDLCKNMIIKKMIKGYVGDVGPLYRNANP